MQTFLQENSEKMVEVKDDGEQPIENYLLYKKYIALIENNLEEFLKIEKIKVEKLIEACQRISELDENALYCLDYILACTEYQDFCDMMTQYRSLYNYEYEEENLEIDLP